jgi:hypothetical protein
MKTDKKRVSFNSIVICSLMVSVVSISNVNAARQGAGSQERVEWCEGKMADCIADITNSCGTSDSVRTRLCESSETTACEGAYGESSSCETRPKIVDTPVKPTAGGQDAKIAPPPTNNGVTRTPARAVEPMNKSLVVPKKKSKPSISQPKQPSRSTSNFDEADALFDKRSD